MHNTIDIERCVWDLDYRLRVKQLLNAPVDGMSLAANENMPGTAQQQEPDSATRH